MKLNGPNGDSVELNKNSIKDGTKVSINQVGEDELEIFSQYNTTKDGAYTLDANELSAFATDLEEHDLDGNIEVLSDEDIDDILKSKNQTVNDENSIVCQFVKTTFFLKSRYA